MAAESCCDSVGEVNRDCYRAQCFATTRSLAATLGLKPEGHSSSFQSRLGRTPWIRPYTDHVLPELAGRGVRRLASRRNCGARRWRFLGNLVDHGIVTTASRSDDEGHQNGSLQNCLHMSGIHKSVDGLLAEMFWSGEPGEGPRTRL